MLNHIPNIGFLAEADSYGPAAVSIGVCEMRRVHISDAGRGVRGPEVGPARPSGRPRLFSPLSFAVLLLLLLLFLEFVGFF